MSTALEKSARGSFVASQVARTNRNVLLTVLGMSLVLAAAAAGGSRHVANGLHGPFSTPLSALRQGRADGRAQLFVSVKADRVVDSGLRARTLVTGRQTARYALLEAGEDLLLVKSDDAVTSPDVTGELEDFSEFVDLDARDKLEADPRVGRRLLPMMLVVNDYRAWVAFGALVWLAGLVVALALLLRLLGWRTDPSTHPIRRMLAQLGDAEAWSARVDEEVASADAVKADRFRVTRTLLVHAGIYKLTVLPLDSIVWMYAAVRNTRKAFVTVSRDWSVGVAMRDGTRHKLRVKKPAAEETLQAVARRSPWILFGWYQPLEQDWTRNRAKVLATVDDRRRASGA